MTIRKIVEFLKNEESRNFFKELQKKSTFTINEVQKLIEESPEKPIKDLLTQVDIQKKIGWKLIYPEDLIFTRKGAEQCSSSLIAEYNASKMESYEKVADLCCGIGIDLISLAKKKEIVFAVDSDEETLLAAQFNCRSQNITNVIFINDKAENFKTEVDAVYADPDRRKNNKRNIKAEDYSPSLEDLLRLNIKFPNMIIKLSPAVNYKSFKIRMDHTLEFVSEKGTLKEILLCLGDLKTKNVNRKAVLLPQSLNITDDKVCNIAVNRIDEYVYEPDPAIIRAGLAAELASKIGFNLIDDRSAILTSNHKIDDSYGKLYQVQEILPYSLRNLKIYLKANEIGELILKTRGFSESVETFRRKLRLRGKNKVIIYILKLSNKHLMLILKKID